MAGLGMKEVAIGAAAAVVVLSATRLMCDQRAIGTVPAPCLALLVLKIVPIVTAPAVVILSATRAWLQQRAMGTAAPIRLTPTISLSRSRLDLLLPRCTHRMGLALAFIIRIRVVRPAIVRRLGPTRLAANRCVWTLLYGQSSKAFGTRLGRARRITDLIVVLHCTACLAPAQATTRVQEPPIAFGTQIAPC